MKTKIIAFTKQKNINTLTLKLNQAKDEIHDELHTNCRRKTTADHSESSHISTLNNRASYVLISQRIVTKRNVSSSSH